MSINREGSVMIFGKLHMNDHSISSQMSLKPTKKLAVGEHRKAAFILYIVCLIILVISLL
jgi:hypothetical protein